MKVSQIVNEVAWECGMPEEAIQFSMRMTMQRSVALFGTNFGDLELPAEDEPAFREKMRKLMRKDPKTWEMSRKNAAAFESRNRIDGERN